MAKMTIKGLDEFVDKVERLGRNPAAFVKRAIYAGADVMANEIHAAINGLPVDNDFGIKKKPKNGITSEEKASLLAGFGISKMDESDARVTVAIGFKGKSPSGVTNATVMRRIESGTSVMQKRPTIRPAANRAKSQAIAAMQKQFETDLKEQFNN